MIEFTETKIGFERTKGWLAVRDGAVLAVFQAVPGQKSEVCLAVSFCDAFMDAFAPAWPSLAKAKAAFVRELEETCSEFLS